MSNLAILPREDTPHHNVAKKGHKRFARQNKRGSMERYIDNQPIIDMLARIAETGRTHFHADGVWEVCLCAIILTINPHCKTEKILEALPHGDKALDECDVLNTMANLGYFARPAECSVKDIDTRLLPGIFIPSKGLAYIVLGKDSDGALQYYNPRSKTISLTPPERNTNGKVWFFQNFDENRPATSKFMRAGSGHTWFRALLGRFKGTFAQVLVAGFILNIIALATPLFIMLVYDRVIAAGSIGTLPMLSLGAFIAIGFEWQLRRIRSRGLSWLAGRLDNIVGNRIFAHLISLTPDLIEKASVAAQIARIKTFESVRDFFSGSVFLSLLETPFVVISIAAIALIAGPLVFVPLFMILGYIALFAYIRSRVKVAIRLAAKTSSARQQFSIETFEKLECIRGHGLNAKWQEKFRHLSGREMMAHFHLGWLGVVAETVAHSLNIIAAVATIGFGVHMIWAGAISSGALVATMILVWRVVTPFYSLCTMVPRLEQLRNSIRQVNDLMDIDTEAQEAKSTSRLTQIKGKISFQNVSFQYEEDSDLVFKDLSFNADAGDVVAITGGGGTGKSTILKLVKSMHRANTGQIMIDGFDIRQLDTPDLRRKIAYVPKAPHFFDGSVLENLRLANLMADQDEIIKALELANAWEDVQALKDGLNTIIGAHEKIVITNSLASRLSLARAYIHPSNIMLIDDLSNSLLSGKTGLNLKSYIARARGKRTILLCTYREDYMKLADTIVALKDDGSSVCGARDVILPQLNSRTGEAA